jgi:DNA-nicking Smr family endonuclease
MARAVSIFSSSMKHRAIKPEERALWRAAMSGVAREGARKAAVAPAEESPLSAFQGEEGRGEVGDRRRSKSLPPPHLTSPPPGAERNKSEIGPGLDRRTALRLKRGQLPIEARLDLHGLTQAEAHRDLASFIARASAAGKRALLIVTGKGTREGGGVLRAAVPRWLDEPAMRALVLAVTPALPRDGGGGALYLLLRRAR